MGDIANEVRACTSTKQVSPEESEMTETTETREIWTELLSDGPSMSAAIGAVFYGVEEWHEFECCPDPERTPDMTLDGVQRESMKFVFLGSNDPKRSNFNVVLQNKQGRYFQGWYDFSSRKGRIALTHKKKFEISFGPG